MKCFDQKGLKISYFLRQLDNITKPGFNANKLLFKLL